MAKYNNSGALDWVKGFRTSQMGISNRHQITLDNTGNILFAGKFYDSLYADPGPGTVLYLNDDTEYDMFLIKLDGNGNYLWSAAFPCNDNTQIEDLVTDSAGDVIMTGNFAGEVDFAPGPSQYILSTAPTISRWGFIVKLHSSGSLYFAHKTGGSGSNVSSALILPSGEFYIFGEFNASAADFDPGTGTFNMYSQNGAHFICRFTPQGSFVSGWQTGGISVKTTFDSDYNIIMAGVVSGLVDMDPGPGVFNLNPYGTKVFLSKLDSSMNHLWSLNWNSNLL